MKLCKTCKRDITRGSTNTRVECTHCLVCQVARAMATFHWTGKRYPIERAGQTK